MASPCTSVPTDSCTPASPLTHISVLRPSSSSEPTTLLKSIHSAPSQHSSLRTSAVVSSTCGVLFNLQSIFERRRYASGSNPSRASVHRSSPPSVSVRLASTSDFCSSSELPDKQSSRHPLTSGSGKDAILFYLSPGSFPLPIFLLSVYTPWIDTWSFAVSTGTSIDPSRLWHNSCDSHLQDCLFPIQPRLASFAAHKG